MDFLEISSFSDIGLVRPNNEDSFLVLPPWQEPALSRQACLFGVADGMGGHASGEVASKLAMTTMKTWFSELPAKDLSLSQVEDCFNEANRAIWKKASESKENHGMGTTLTSALVTQNQALLGHVGDTRAYLFRNNELRQITRDHTLVAEQIRLGSLTPAQAKVHPARHILSRAMGVREYVNVDTVLIELMPDDIILLCSDGIYGQIEESKIASEIGGVKEFKQIARALVSEANKSGGKDNATAVLFKISEVPVSFPARFSIRRIKGMCSDWWDKFRS